jgi:hypothetical protein
MAGEKWRQGRGSLIHGHEKEKEHEKEIFDPIQDRKENWQQKSHFKICRGKIRTSKTCFG